MARIPTPRRARLAALLPVLFALASGGARAADVETKAPSPKAPFRLYQWKSAGGIVCFWRPPEHYDPEKGANLTMILHGTGLTHEWGFANHPWKTFRPDDFVVSPDGPTPNGNTFLFMEGDSKKVHAFLEEWKNAIKVRAVFLYGHSQGSFFALQYAGDYPDDVTGVVAHASGLWRSSRIGKHGYHQAIVLMHGTQDPVVPYGQSVGAFEALRDAGYPTVRLRSLEWWNHWPAEVNGPVAHTSQQLAWVEGMTTTDPERLQACLDVLAKVEGDQFDQHDFAGAWSLAGRIAGLAEAPDALKSRAAEVRKQVEALADAHVEEMKIPAKIAFDGGAWIGHLPIFLRAFQGLPAAESLAAKWKATLEQQQKDAIAALRKYGPAAQKGKVAEAFDAAMEAISSGYLYVECWSPDLRKALKEWHKDAKKQKLSKPSLKTYDLVFDDFEKALVNGSKAFEEVNRKHWSP
jgi:predicted esterase